MNEYVYKVNKNPIVKKKKGYGIDTNFSVLHILIFNSK
jgi:hypothetical protein